MQPTRTGRAARGSWAAGALALTGLLVAAASGRAHLGHVIARAERYLKLDVADHQARVVVSLTLGAAEGRRVLEAADADGDRRVDQTERDAYLAQWGSGLRDEVPIFVDGERVEPEAGWTDGYMDPIGPVRAVPVTVEMVARFELSGGEQRVVVQDRMVRREVFDRTDVAFRARRDAELVASAVGAEPNAPTPDVAYGPELARGEEPVAALRAVIRTPPRSSSVPWAWIAGALIVAILVVATVAGRRRGSRA